jgi:hypothetical protein
LSTSGSLATWKQLTRSIVSPVSGSLPGRIEPSDSTTAGTLRSMIAAVAPTGGLSHATTATRPRMSLPSKCRDRPSFVVSRPMSEYRICGVPLRWPSEIPPE